MGKFIGLVICLFALILPWRLRVLFSEFLGWVTQFIYFTYFGILNFMLKELKVAKEARTSEDSEKSNV